jgi:hypothetical protein
VFCRKYFLTYTRWKTAHEIVTTGFMQGADSRIRWLFRSVLHKAVRHWVLTRAEAQISSFTFQNTEVINLVFLLFQAHTKSSFHARSGPIRSSRSHNMNLIWSVSNHISISNLITVPPCPCIAVPTSSS